MATTLSAQGHRGIVFNPRPVWDFAKASGILAKTDVIDAQVIARCGYLRQPPATVFASESAVGVTQANAPDESVSARHTLA